MQFYLFRPSQRAKQQSGLSFVEIIVILLILGVLAVLVIPRIVEQPSKARVFKAKEDIQTIVNALDSYRTDNGFYPSTDQGLEALTMPPVTNPVPPRWRTNGYLNVLPLDPWGRPYHYIYDATNNRIKVFTNGPTGQPGGTGKNAPIGTWHIQKKSLK